MSIEVKNLIKAFEDKVVINDISFKVDDGEILAIVGFSGSGKSTVLKLISGLIPARAAAHKDPVVALRIGE